MHITVAKTAGFCFGVNNAVKMAFDAAEKYGKTNRVFTLGPLIHNEDVVKKLEERGVKVLDDVDSVKEGDVVVLRAHGVTPETEETIKNAGGIVLDATCPFVAKIHARVKSEYEAGKQIIIIGDKNHPEIIGINGCCDNTAIIVGSLEECQNIKWEKKEFSCVVQTTFNGYIYEKIKNFLKSSIDLIEFYDSICNATSCRQAEAREIASRSELMIVIGSATSSNTLRLYEICREACPNVILVQSPDELRNREVNF